MMRYGVALAVALTAALLLLGVLRDPLLRNDGPEVPSDELLAYSLATGSTVTLGLNRQTKEIRLSSWCVIANALPEERFDYVVRVEWLGSTGRVLGEHRLAFESRVSSAAAGLESDSFASKLAYSDALVTDSRTVRIVVPKFGERSPTKMRLSAPDNNAGRILVRATYPAPRPALEIAAVDNRLQLSERLELIRDRSSVGYDDLPDALRSVALGSWQRRLDAAGIEGKDYFVERLLIGTGRSGSGLVIAQSNAWSVQRNHSLAFSVRASVPVDIVTAPRSTLLVTSAVGQEPHAVTANDQGHCSIEVGQGDQAQTFVVASNSDSAIPIQVRVAPDRAAAMLGPTQTLDGTTSLGVSPQIRRSRYYQLDPVNPLLLTVARQQTFLGVQVRGVHSTLQGNVDAEIDGEHASITVALVPSTFEQWLDRAPATDAQRLFLRIPPAAKQVSLRGSPQLRVALFTMDPEVTVDRLAPPYDVPLAADMRWQYARYDIDRTVALQPDNAEALVNSGRSLDLLAQSRIVPSATAQQQPERVLTPSTEAVQRHVLEPLSWGPGVPLPEDVAIALDDPRRGYVPNQGLRAGHVRVAYRLAAEDVGKTLEFLVDHVTLQREEPLASAGQFDVPVAKGTHEFAIAGQHEDSQFLLDATPLEAAGALRRRTAYRILPGKVLRFAVVKSSETVSAVVTTYLQNARLVSMNYAIQGRQQTDFLHSVTPMRGAITGMATEFPGTWYWETGPTKRLQQHRAVVTIGNDVARGPVALVLRNLNPSPVFVAVVLVGQGENKLPTLQRFWSTEEP